MLLSSHWMPKLAPRTPVMESPSLFLMSIRATMLRDVKVYLVLDVGQHLFALCILCISQHCVSRADCWAVYLLSALVAIVWVNVCLIIMLALYISPLFIKSPCIVDKSDLPTKPLLLAHKGASAVRDDCFSFFFVLKKIKSHNRCKHWNQRWSQSLGKWLSKESCCCHFPSHRSVIRSSCSEVQCASVPGASNKLGKWVSEWSSTHFFSMG